MNRWRGDTVLLICMTRLMAFVKTSAGRIYLYSNLSLLDLPRYCLNLAFATEMVEERARDRHCPLGL